MAKEAYELEAFLRQLERVKDAETLADQARDLASKLKVAQILEITPKIELPGGVKTETLTFKTGSKADILKLFDDRKIRISSYAQDLIDQIDPVKFTDRDPMQLIWVSGRDLGITKSARYRQFVEAGQAKGYNLVSPEVGLYLRLQDINQPLNDWYWMAMEPMTDRCDNPSVFGLAHYGDGFWLNAPWARPDDLWSPGLRLVFSLPASETQKS